MPHRRNESDHLRPFACVRRGKRTRRSYRGVMARVGGRNAAMSWIAGLFCAAVVAALLWLALPMGPMLVQYVGDTLRMLAPGAG